MFWIYSSKIDILKLFFLNIPICSFNLWFIKVLFLSHCFFEKLKVSYNYNKAIFHFIIFFYTQKAFVFQLVVDFYIVHDNIVAFFSFLFFLLSFDIFHELLFQIFLIIFIIFSWWIFRHKKHYKTHTHTHAHTHTHTHTQSCKSILSWFRKFINFYYCLKLKF